MEQTSIGHYRHTVTDGRQAASQNFSNRVFP